MVRKAMVVMLVQLSLLKGVGRVKGLRIAGDILEVSKILVDRTCSIIILVQIEARLRCKGMG